MQDTRAIAQLARGHGSTICALVLVQQFRLVAAQRLSTQECQSTAVHAQLSTQQSPQPMTASTADPNCSCIETAAQETQAQLSKLTLHASAAAKLEQRVSEVYPMAKLRDGILLGIYDGFAKLCQQSQAYSAPHSAHFHELESQPLLHQMRVISRFLSDFNCRRDLNDQYQSAQAYAQSGSGGAWLAARCQEAGSFRLCSAASDLYRVLHAHSLVSADSIPHDTAEVMPVDMQPAFVLSLAAHSLASQPAYATQLSKLLLVRIQQAGVRSTTSRLSRLSLSQSAHAHNMTAEHLPRSPQKRSAGRLDEDGNLGSPSKHVNRLGFEAEQVLRQRHHQISTVCATMNIVDLPSGPHKQRSLVALQAQNAARPGALAVRPARHPAAFSLAVFRRTVGIQSRMNWDQLELCDICNITQMCMLSEGLLKKRLSAAAWLPLQQNALLSQLYALSAFLNQFNGRDEPANFLKAVWGRFRAPGAITHDMLCQQLLDSKAPLGKRVQKLLHDASDSGVFGNHWHDNKFKVQRALRTKLPPSLHCVAACYAVGIMADCDDKAKAVSMMESGIGQMSQLVLQAKQSCLS